MQSLSYFLLFSARACKIASLWRANNPDLVPYNCVSVADLEALGRFLSPAPNLQACPPPQMREARKLFARTSPRPTANNQDIPQEFFENPCPNSRGFLDCSKTSLVFVLVSGQDNLKFAFQVFCATAVKHLPLQRRLSCLAAIFDLLACFSSLFVEFLFHVYQIDQPLQLFVVAFVLLFCVFFHHFCAFFRSAMHLAQRFLRHSLALCPYRISWSHFSWPLVKSADTLGFGGLCRGGIWKGFSPTCCILFLTRPSFQVQGCLVGDGSVFCWQPRLCSHWHSKCSSKEAQVPSLCHQWQGCQPGRQGRHGNRSHLLPTPWDFTILPCPPH